LIEILPMIRPLILFSSIVLLISCGNSSTATNTAVNKKDSSSSTKIIIDSSALEPSWSDSLTWAYIKYLKRTRNPMIRDAQADTVLDIKWIFDGMNDTDSASYYIMHLGYDVEDASEARFETAGWFYIDSATRKTYEYDVAQDSIWLIDLNKKYGPNEFEPTGYTINASNDNKVYFHNAPDSSTKRKAFFNTRQVVYVSKEQDGYGYVEFFNTKGKESDGWIEMKDLQLYVDSSKEK